MCWGVEFHKFFPTFFIPEYKKMYFFKIIFFYFSAFYSSERFVSTHTFNMVNATKCLWVVPYRSGEIKKHIFWNHLKWDIEKTRICSFLMVYYATTRPKLVGRPRVPSIPHSPLTPAGGTLCLQLWRRRVLSGQSLLMKFSTHFTELVWWKGGLDLASIPGGVWTSWFFVLIL